MINHKFWVAPIALVLSVCASGASAQLQPTLMTLITPIAGGEFGMALAVGDFDNDGRDDLAVGIRSADNQRGKVQIIKLSSPTEKQIWSQDSAGIAGVAEELDFFGFSLASGDFDGDGHDDLAIGAFGEAIEGNSLDAAGAVTVLYGSVDLLSSDGSQLWTQNSAGIQGVAEDGGEFGYALAAGDFDNDGKADAAIGAPDAEDIYRMDGSNFTLIDEVLRAGAVSVYYSDLGDYRQIWHQRHPDNSEGIGGTVEAHDEVGAALVVGDWNGDGVDDLIIGAPGEDTTEFSLPGADSGTVGVLFGRTASIFQDRFE